MKPWSKDSVPQNAAGPTWQCIFQSRGGKNSTEVLLLVPPGPSVHAPARMQSFFSSATFTSLAVPLHQGGRKSNFFWILQYSGMDVMAGGSG